MLRRRQTEALAWAELAAARLAPGACPSDDDLVQFVVGQLASSSAESVRLHLASCLDCAVEAEALGRLTTWRRRVPVRTGFEKPAIRLANRLRALIRFEPPLVLAVVPRGVAAPSTTGVEVNNRAFAAMRRGHHDKALRQLDRSPSLDADGHYLRGVCLIELGDVEAAAAAFAAGVALRPRDARLRYCRGQALALTAQVDLALTELQAARSQGGPYGRRAQALAVAIEHCLERSS